MTLSIAKFSEFIVSPEHSFKTLQGVTAIIQEGVLPIRRTSQFAEADIMLDGKRYLLSTPLEGGVTTSLEHFCLALKRVQAPFLTEYRLLLGELPLEDSMGNMVFHDVILQAIPNGERLDQAVMFVATARLRAALKLLKQEMKAIGFVHSNLKPSNLIYGEDGRLYPIRCYYSHIGATESEVESDFAQVEAYLDSVAEVAEIGAYTPPTDYRNTLPYDKVFLMQDTMIRVCKDGLYGYLDCHNEEKIPPQYTYAEDFFENRAVVQTLDSKMGVIDSRGHWVIKPIYDMLGIDKGDFEARIGDEWIKIDYSGTTIK